MPDINTMLLPFSEEEQGVLKEVDIACKVHAKKLGQDMQRAAMRNKDWEPDTEGLVTMSFLSAYGILMNRAIDAGWVTGIHLNKESKL